MKRTPDKLTDHDLLIRLDTKLDGLTIKMDNHLRHHWAVTISLLVTTFTAVASLFIALLTK